MLSNGLKANTDYYGKMGSFVNKILLDLSCVLHVLLGYVLLIGYEFESCLLDYLFP